MLGGDFNGGLGDAELTAIDAKFVSTEFIAPADRVVMDLRFGEARIDQIYVSRDIACDRWTTVSAVELPRGRFSDHPALFADLLVPLPSAPRPRTTVPDVREMSEAKAINEIRSAGLEPTSVGETGPNAWVWRQSPEGGAIVERGSTVTLQLRTGPIP